MALLDHSHDKYLKFQFKINKKYFWLKSDQNMDLPPSNTIFYPNTVKVNNHDIISDLFRRKRKAQLDEMRQLPQRR